jgi:hypothetical protein
MNGLMMQMPLMISSLIRHADRLHGDTQIVSRSVEDPLTAMPTATRTTARDGSHAHSGASA